MPRTGIQTQPGCRRIALLSATIALLAGLVFTTAAPAATGGYPYANYDGPGSDAATSDWMDSGGNRFSPYSYVYRNCTDCVAWKLSTANGVEEIRDYGDAAHWADAAVANGFRVDHQPAPGAVAWWGGGQYGHVAWVASVGSRSVKLKEYNHVSPGEYGARAIRPRGRGCLHPLQRPGPKDRRKWQGK